MTVTLLLASVAFVYAANNLGVIRSLYASLSKNGAMLYTVLGLVSFSIGYLVEGSKVGSSLLPSLIESMNPTYVVVLAVVFLILLAITFLRLPASISNVSVGTIIGVALAQGGIVNYNGLVRILGLWILAPVSSMALAIIIYRLYVWSVSSLTLASASRAGRMVGVVAVVVSSYALAANNLGILTAFSNGIIDIVSVLASALIGAALLSSLVAWKLGWQVAQLSPTGYAASLLAGSATLWVYTQYGVPASLSQCAVASMMALSLGKRPSVINRGATFEVLVSWPLFLVLSAFVGYTIEFFFSRFF